ncbi:uncharacterized protein LOC119432879 isoform X1 [Dermacentor silvarum]|uniref:uncharacterized protein LOC119432879 isoform X1 n=1 Tax=Dermacentor silvarum TaxID=543639 RepID=UPI0021018B16|nr:uncharacterized protein LOC119432879 isoform X1 [Dermacentor silvarum]
MFMTFPTIQRREHFGEPRLLHDVQAQGQVPDQVRNGHQQAGVNLRKRPGCEAGVRFSSCFPCESRSHQTSSYCQLKQGKASHGPKSRLGHRQRSTPLASVGSSTSCYT